jgi:hypothetical protein
VPASLSPAISNVAGVAAVGTTGSLGGAEVLVVEIAVIGDEPSLSMRLVDGVGVAALVVEVSPNTADTKRNPPKTTAASATATAMRRRR